MIAKREDAVSPVIGVMLMIVVTVIIAAIVSGFAGGYADDDRRAPTVIFSCKALEGGLLFTHESGDYVELIDCNIVLTNGEDTKRFSGANLGKVSPSGEAAGFALQDMQLNTGNQFYIEADNNGTAVEGGYLGWNNPEFYLTRNEIGTFRIFERESGQTISKGVIDI